MGNIAPNESDNSPFTVTVTHQDPNTPAITATLTFGWQVTKLPSNTQPNNLNVTGDRQAIPQRPYLAWTHRTEVASLTVPLIDQAYYASLSSRLHFRVLRSSLHRLCSGSTQQTFAPVLPVLSRLQTCLRHWFTRSQKESLPLLICLLSSVYSREPMFGMSLTMYQG